MLRENHVCELRCTRNDPILSSLLPKPSKKVSQKVEYTVKSSKLSDVRERIFLLLGILARVLEKERRSNCPTSRGRSTLVHNFFRVAWQLMGWDWANVNSTREPRRTRGYENRVAQEQPHACATAHSGLRE